MYNAFVFKILQLLRVHRKVRSVNFDDLRKVRGLCGMWICQHNKYEPSRDKTNKVACAPSEDSDQPGHPPSLIRVFAVSMKKAWVLSYPLSAQRRLWSDWADAQADLSLRWAHSHIVGFVTRRLLLSMFTVLLVVNVSLIGFVFYTGYVCIKHVSITISVLCFDLAVLQKVEIQEEGHSIWWHPCKCLIVT